MKNKKRIVWSVIFLVCGLVLCSFPFWVSLQKQWHTTQYVKAYKKQYETKPDQQKNHADREDEGYTDDELKQLYLQCRAYNWELYEQKQSGFSDPWSYTESPDIAFFREQKDRGFGYIRIPAMDLILPLYVGASDEHMKQGAAILGQTSLPTGGENTNCVIAAHRGYRGAAFFRDIEKLQLQDVIEIHTFWGTLYYQVVQIAVIDACDSDRVKIRDGKDMITLLTCHPYRAGGKQRYVVFCERTDDDMVTEQKVYTKTPEITGAEEDTGEKTVWPEKLQSQKDIMRENLVRKIAGLFVILSCVLTGRRYSRERRTCKERNNRQERKPYV